MTESSTSPQHESAGLREQFRRRRISLRTMDAPLRLATGGAAASLAGAVLLIVLRDVGGWQVVLPATGGIRTTLAGPLFVATLVLMAVGFGYVVTGAVLAQRTVALLSVLLLTGVMGYQTGVLGLGGVRALLPGWAMLATRLMLGAIWVATIGAVLWRRGRPGDAAEDRRLRIVLLVTYCGLFGGYLLVLRATSPTVGGLTIFPLSVNLLMVNVSLLCMPILQVAAVDFAEWGELAGERLLALAGGTAEAGRRLGRIAVPAAACLALLVTAWIRQPGPAAHRLLSLSHGVLLVAAAVAVLLIAGRLLRLGRQAWPETLNFGGIVAVVAVLVFAVAPAVGLAVGRFSVKPTPEISSAGRYTAAAYVRSLTGPGGSTLLVPAGWLPKVNGKIETFFDRSPSLGFIALTVTRGTVGSATVVSLARGLGTPRGAAAPDGPLQRVALKPKPPGTTATVWLERVPGGPAGYLFYGIADGKDRAGAALQLEAMIHSFRLPGQPAARIPAESAVVTPAAAQQATDDRFTVVGGAVDLGLSVLALVLVAGIGRAWPSRVRGALLLFATWTLMTLFYFADAFGRVLGGAGTTWLYLGNNGVLAGAGTLGLAVLAFAAGRQDRWARRLPGTLTRFAGGVLALTLLDVLYNRALSASRIAVWAAVIVLVAIAWDVTMSGESMTNHASRYVPRASRVLLFFGYVILLAATVVYFSGQRGAGSGQAVTDVFFEPEAITQAALFRLALPLLLLLFLLHTFGEEEREPAEHGGQASPRPDDAAAGAHPVPEPAMSAGARTGGRTPARRPGAHRKATGPS